MSRHNYQYSFDRSISLKDIDDLITRSIVSVEATHGSARLRLDGRYWVDRPSRTLVIDGTTELGSSLNQIFTNHLRHDFGADAFTVKRVGCDGEPKFEHNEAGAT